MAPADVRGQTRNQAAEEISETLHAELDANRHAQEPATDPVSDFTLDFCDRNREEELAVRPDDLFLGNAWAFKLNDLEVTEVELVSPERKVDEKK